jgi:hypothetical protein
MYHTIEALMEQSKHPTLKDAQKNYFRSVSVLTWKQKKQYHILNLCTWRIYVLCTHSKGIMKMYSVSTKPTRGFEKLWRANKLS